MKLPLLVYFACLPLFFSASAMSWPFPDSADSAPPASRDCVIVTDAHEPTQDPVEEEEEEPDCD